MCGTDESTSDKDLLDLLPRRPGIFAEEGQWPEAWTQSYSKGRSLKPSPLTSGSSSTQWNHWKSIRARHFAGFGHLLRRYVTHSHPANK